MATTIETSLAGEIWHLSIEDLLAPMNEAARLGGPGPFVINLSASSAPIGPPAKGFNTAPGTHVYQIHRMEDRRLRYRLRLGPFSTEDEAEALLPAVREMYPSALTATADAEDLRTIASLRPKNEPVAPVPAAREPVLRAAPAPAPAVQRAASTVPPAASQQPAPAALR
ncbi:MAG TPA: SPOR domain-containing protein, partial [Acetobacteraceae bacterium]|nr:SPOR domain-containing protein [Acetobacteraceae bacterium]